MSRSAALLLGAESLRDGGSLGASFQSADTTEYLLVFPVRLIEHATGMSERIGYKSPEVIDRLAGTSMPITWEQARALIAQLFPLARETAHRDALGLMNEAALASGALPASVPRFIGPTIKLT
jgi:hypothetical protein